MCLVVHCPSNAGTVGQFGTTVAPVAPRKHDFLPSDRGQDGGVESDSKST